MPVNLLGQGPPDPRDAQIAHLQRLVQQLEREIGWLREQLVEKDRGPNPCARPGWDGSL